MNFEKAAVLVYGSLSLSMAFVLALAIDVQLAALLFVVATALTYVFQVVVLFAPHAMWFHLSLWAAVILTTLAGFIEVARHVF